MKQRVYKNLAEHKAQRSIVQKRLWEDSSYRQMQINSHTGLPSKKKGRHGDSEYALEQKWIETVFAQDCFTCRRCGRIFDKPSSELHAHHIYRREDFHEVRFETTNGVALCIACHKIVDSVTKKLELVIAFDNAITALNNSITEENAHSTTNISCALASAVRFERLRKQLMAKTKDIRFIKDLKSNVKLTGVLVPVYDY